MSKILKLILFFAGAAVVIAFLVSIVTSRFFVPQGGVFLSEDSGNSWEKSNRMLSSSGIARANITEIEFNKLDTRIVYIGTSGNSAFKSLDGGDSWIKVQDKNNTLSSSATIHSIAIDNTRPNYTLNLPERIYLAVSQGGFGRVLKSENGGESFREVYIVSRPRFAVGAISIDPQRASVVWAGTDEGLLLRSVDYGETWEKIGEFLGKINSILIDPQDSNDVFVSTKKDGIFKSFNGGFSWTETTNGLDDLEAADLIETAVMDPRRPSNIYLGTWFGLVRSFNGGFSWSGVDLVIPDEALPVFDVEFDPQASNVIYATAGANIYKSKDLGGTWTVRNLASKNRTRSIAVDPFNSLRVLVGIHKFR